MTKSAAKGGDLTNHGGSVVTSSCSKNVLINGLPAANLMSVHACPMVTPGSPPVPHGVGGAVVSPGVPGVLINGIPAIGAGDRLFCVGSAPAELSAGSGDVVYGGTPGQTATPIVNRAASAKKSASSKENVQAEAAAAGDAGLAAGAAPCGAVTENPADEGAFRDSENGDGASAENGENTMLTVRDFAEILMTVEEKEGYEAARRYAAGKIDYLKISGMAREFVLGNDENPDNDPNVMPSRFMLLYGACDGELCAQGRVDRHPDGFRGEPEHEVSVANLRRGLWILGYAVSETGPFDNTLYGPFLKYLNRFSPVDSDNCAYGDSLVVEKGGDPDMYRPGVPYRYPWVPFRLTLERYEGPRDGSVRYEIFDRSENNRVLLAESALGGSSKIELLLPDAEDVAVFVGCREVDSRSVMA